MKITEAPTPFRGRPFRRTDPMQPNPASSRPPLRGASLVLLQGALAITISAALAGCVTREVIIERGPAPAARPAPAPDSPEVEPRVGLMGDLSDPFAPDSERVAAPAPAVGWNAAAPETTVRYYSQAGEYDPEAVTVTRYYYGDEGTYYEDAPSAWGNYDEDAYYGGYYSDYYRYGYVHYRPAVYNYYRPYYAYRPYRHYGRPFWAYAGHAYRGPWYAYHGGWYTDPHYWGPYGYDAPFFIVASYYDPFYYGGWYYDPFCIRPGFAISFGWGSYHDWGSYYAGYDRGYRDGYYSGGYYGDGYGYYGDGYGYRGRRYHEEGTGLNGNRGPLRPILAGDPARPGRLGLRTPTADRIARVDLPEAPRPVRTAPAADTAPTGTARAPSRAGAEPSDTRGTTARPDRRATLAETDTAPARPPTGGRIPPRTVDQVRPPRAETAGPDRPDLDDPRLRWVTPRPQADDPAVSREEPASADQAPARQRPRYYPAPRTRRDSPRYAPRDETPRYSPPPRDERPGYSSPPREETPRYSPPPREEAPRYTPPPREERRDEPRYSPPPRQERRADPPRREPARREEPRRSDSRGSDDDRGDPRRR